MSPMRASARGPVPESRGIAAPSVPRTVRPGHRAARQAGFTLVEVMVSLVIGLAVVSALIAAYVASFQSGRHNDAMVQMTEDATLALTVMRQQVAQAGFSTARA